MKTIEPGDDSMPCKGPVAVRVYVIPLWFFSSSVDDSAWALGGASSETPILPFACWRANNRNCDAPIGVRSFGCRLVRRTLPADALDRTGGGFGARLCASVWPANTGAGASGRTLTRGGSRYSPAVGVVGISGNFVPVCGVGCNAARVVPALCMRRPGCCRHSELDMSDCAEPTHCARISEDWP